MATRSMMKDAVDITEEDEIGAKLDLKNQDN